jgi:cell division septum initiation protein DivIVA
MKDNVQLLQEINDLRKRRHHLEQQIKEGEQKLHQVGQKYFNPEADPVIEMEDELSVWQHRVAELRIAKEHAR